MLICPKCGIRVSAGGSPLATNGSATAATKNPPPAISTPGLAFAGFWLRLVAFLIDFVVLVPVALLVQSVMIPLFGGLMAWWMYFALFESSRWQATLGKRAVGIKVTDVNGVHLRFGRASLRFFSKILSMAIVGFGFLMAGWTRHKQGLHDLLAGTLVLRTR